MNTASSSNVLCEMFAVSDTRKPALPYSSLADDLLLNGPQLQTYKGDTARSASTRHLTSKPLPEPHIQLERCYMVSVEYLSRQQQALQRWLMSLRLTLPFRMVILSNLVAETCKGKRSGSHTNSSWSDSHAHQPIQIKIQAGTTAA